MAEDEEGDEKGRVPQVSVPSQREVEEMLIRRKKKVGDAAMMVCYGGSTTGATGAIHQ